MSEIEDPWSDSYAVHKPDAFDDMAEQALMNSVGIPSFNRKATIETPATELTPRERKAQEATKKIIIINMMQLGLGGLAIGSTATVNRNSQSDDQDVNILINPVTGTLVKTGIAGGLGRLIGYQSRNNSPIRTTLVYGGFRSNTSNEQYMGIYQKVWRSNDNCCQYHLEYFRISCL